MSSEETVDVVQTVVRYEASNQFRYLLGLRSKDNYWEFLGGKVESGESLKDAAIRELNEETNLDLKKQDLVKYREGSSYRSKDNKKYRLNPVLIELDSSKARKMSQDGLSIEHIDFEWIKLNEFYKYETLGQYQALENLGLIEGDVALAVPRRSSKYLALKRSENTSSSGLWNFPGGKVEDELEKEAAERELKEETNLEGEIIESGNPYINNGELGYWRIFPFLVEVEGTVKLNNEHSDHEWLKPEEIQKLDTLGTFRALQNLEKIDFEQ